MTIQVLPFLSDPKILRRHQSQEIMPNSTHTR